jgi:hypothetical protein
MRLVVDGLWSSTRDDLTAQVVRRDYPGRPSRFLATVVRAVGEDDAEVLWHRWYDDGEAAQRGALRRRNADLRGGEDE